MGISFWVFPLLATKLLVYLGVSAAIGGVFMAYMLSQREELRSVVSAYIQLFVSLAVLSTILGFYLQVGAFSEEGLSGMWDVEVAAILWDSPIGDAVLFRVTGFFIVLITISVQNHWAQNARLYHWRKAVVIFSFFVGALVLVRSFSLVGHTAELEPVYQGLISLHVFIAAWWMGALWPLWRACSTRNSIGNNLFLHSLMEKFGQFAAFLVPLLIACGCIIGFQLIGSLAEFQDTAYGQLFSIKLLSVIAILILATWHKLNLVPKLLGRKNGEKTLALSIRIEMIIGLIVLVATVIVANRVGPEHSGF